MAYSTALEAIVFPDFVFVSTAPGFKIFTDSLLRQGEFTSLTDQRFFRASVIS